MRFVPILATLIAFAFAGSARAQIIDVEAQPLADNVRRVVRTFEELGHPFPADEVTKLTKAANAQDIKKLQEMLEPHVS